MKLLEENIGKTFSDINCTNVVLGQSPKPVEIKPKVNQWNLFKFISFFTEKETINKRKRQPTDWEKPFANEETNKGLVVVVQSLSCNRLFRNSMNCSLPGPSVHEIFQARILEWVAISFSRDLPDAGIKISCIDRWILYCWATREAHNLSSASPEPENATQKWDKYQQDIRVAEPQMGCLRSCQCAPPTINANGCTGLHHTRRRLRIMLFTCTSVFTNMWFPQVQKSWLLSNI